MVFFVTEREINFYFWTFKEILVGPSDPERLDLRTSSEPQWNSSSTGLVEGERARDKSSSPS